MKYFIHTHFHRIVFLFIAAILLASCASSSPEFPAGIYKSRGGRFLEFTDDGTFFYGYFVDKPIVTGTYKINDQEITFGVETDVFASDAGTVGCEVEGTYKWSIEEGALNFDLVEDGCNDRVGDTNGVMYFPLEEDS